MKVIKLSALLFISLFIVTAAQENKSCGGIPANGSYKWSSDLLTSISIPFELGGNLVVIPVEINNVMTKFILDTGMPMMGGLFTNYSKASTLNLNYSGEAQIGGAGGGFSSAKISSGVKFKLGDLEFYNQTLVVMQESKNLSFFETDGVIGNEILERFIVDINYDNLTITLTEPANFTPPAGAEEIQLPFESIYPFIKCTATMENGATVPLDMVLDLGASHNLSLVLGSQENIVLPGKNLKVSTGRGVTTELFGYTGRIKEFKIGSFSFDNPLVNFNEEKLMSFEKDGNLGSGILRRFNLTFDYANNRMFIKPNKSYNNPFEFNMAGLQYSKSRDGILIIDKVIPNSPGSEAGLEPGDLLVKINGTVAGDINKNDLKKIFEGENKVVELSIKHGETTKTISVKLRRLI
ncbi:MAG: aspartyl protease family protein [bacterium]